MKLKKMKISRRVKTSPGGKHAERGTRDHKRPTEEVTVMKYDKLYGRDRQDQKRREAEERRTAWAEKTPQQQLAALDKRHGKGQGAYRQRVRIAARIAETAETKSKEGTKTSKKKTKK